MRNGSHANPGPQNGCCVPQSWQSVWNSKIFPGRSVNTRNSPCYGFVHWDNGFQGINRSGFTIGLSQRGGPAVIIIKMGKSLQQISRPWSPHGLAGAPLAVDHTILRASWEVPEISSWPMFEPWEPRLSFDHDPQSFLSCNLHTRVFSNLNFAWS